MVASFVALIALAQAVAAAPAQPVTAPSGTLVGCAFLQEGATEDSPAWSGFSIFLPLDREGGPVDASLIRDPEGIFERTGFEAVESGLGWLRLTGRNSVHLRDAGGGIYHARIEGPADRRFSGHISCQIGRFDGPAAAFEFFDDVMRGLNDSGF